MRILLLEDQSSISKPVRRSLEAQGYSVVLAESLKEARLSIIESEFDLYILDVRLPDSTEGGFVLAKEIRLAGFRGRVLMMTARDSLEDRVMGLDIGADDYLVKPFELPELMARVRALLRRDSSVTSNLLTRGRLTFEFTQRQALWDGVVVALTQRELSLLERLVLNADRTVSSEELIDAIWGESALLGVVKVMVYQIRNKISTDVIITQSGRGYRLGACLGTS